MLVANIWNVQALSSATYGSQPLTRAYALNCTDRRTDVEIWYLLNPPVGSNTLRATYRPGYSLNAGFVAASYQNVNTVSPIGAIGYGCGGGINHQIAITTQFPNSKVVGGTYHQSTGPLTISSAFTTSRYNFYNNNTYFGGDQEAVTPGVRTFGFTSNKSNGWGTLAVELRTAADITPPIITSTTATTNVSGSMVYANVSWLTNEPADSQVEYGLTTAYGSTTTLNSSLVTSHYSYLSGLAAGTTYHYRVRSRDGSGNLAVSGDYTFTTPSIDTTPPIIASTTAATFVSSSMAWAYVTWYTNEPADSQVEYGTSTFYGTVSSLNTFLTNSHGVSISPLSPGTLYHYRARSRDAAGNLALSNDQTFLTPTSTMAVLSFSQLASIIEVLSDLIRELVTMLR